MGIMNVFSEHPPVLTQTHELFPRHFKIKTVDLLMQLSLYVRENNSVHVSAMFCTMGPQFGVKTNTF